MASPRGGAGAGRIGRVARGALRVVLGTLRVVLAIVLGVFALVGLAYAALTLTPAGRALVRDVALEQGNALFRGELRARELSALGITGIVLRGVEVTDPTGAQVLAAETIEVELAPLALLAGEIRVVRAAVTSARADLADLGDERGVLAAFAPREPSPPEPEPASEPPVVIVDAIELDAIAARVELPDFGAAGVEALHARARFELRGTARAQLHALTAQLARDDQPIGRIDSTQARWAQVGEDSTLALRGQLARTAIALDARARMPNDPAFETSPLKAKVVLDAVDAEALRALGQGELAGKLKQGARVELVASGTLAALDAQLLLASKAGGAEVRATLRDRDRLELTVQSDGVTPGALWDGAPEQRVTADLEARTQLAGAPDSMPFELSLKSASFGGSPLPSVRAKGRVAGEAVRDLSASAQGYGVTLELSGDASAEQLNLNGTLRAREFTVAGASAGTLDADFIAVGPPTAPRASLALRGSALRYQQSFVIDEAVLEASGGPEVYDVKLNARAPDGRVQLTTRARLFDEAVQLDAAATGAIRSRPFNLRLERAVVGFGGALAVERAVVDALGQRVTARGRMQLKGGGGRDQIRLAARLDLAALSEALQLEPALRGRAQVELTARGTIERPIAELRARGRDLGLHDPGRERPRVDAELDAALDTRQGALRAAFALTSGSDLDLHGELAGSFDARRAPWHGELLASRVEGSLALDALTTEWLEGWLLEPLPMRGRLLASASFAGTIEQPELALTARAQLRHPERAASYELTTELRYRDAAAQLTLGARDAAGALLDARAELSHRARTLRELLALGAALGHEAEWSAALKLEPRALGALPIDAWLASPLDPELAAITAGAELTVQHAPRAEPTASATLRAVKPARGTTSVRIGLAEHACADQELALSVALALADGKADLRASIESTKQPLLDAGAAARVELAPALQGRGAPVLEDAGGRVQLRGIALDALPRLCGLAKGHVSGSIDARALLGADPELTVQLSGRKLSFGAPVGIDLELTAGANASEATLDLELTHGATRSTARGRLPIRWQRESFELLRDRPMSANVKLDRMPVIALLPPSFAISRASGYLNGAVVAGGTLDAPEVGGRIEPERLALTVTGLAQPLHGIGGRIAFSNRRVLIDRLVARDRDGSITLNGSVELQPNNDVRAKLSVKADGFPLRQQGQIAGEVDAEIGVSALMTEHDTRVDVSMKDASAWLLGGELRRGISLDEHPDIVDPRAGERRAREEQEEKDKIPPRPIEISINAEDSFWIRREDFAVKLSTKLELKIDEGKVAVTGPLRIHRGYLQLFGQTFDIDGKSSVDFVGGTPPDPVLDITATTVNRSSNERVSVRIGGRASAPQLEFYVDDAQVDAGRAATALFGGRGRGGDSDAQGEAKSFVAGMMAGVMAMSARRELGDAMPILMIEPAEDMRASRVRAGFELDKLVPGFLENVIRGVYVEGIFAGSGEDENASSGGVQGGVLLELYFPYDLVTAGQYGPGQTWSVDFGWEP